MVSVCVNQHQAAEVFRYIKSLLLANYVVGSTEIDVSKKWKTFSRILNVGRINRAESMRFKIDAFSRYENARFERWLEPILGEEERLERDAAYERHFEGVPEDLRGIWIQH